MSLLTRKRLLPLLPPGDVVYILTPAGGVTGTEVLEVCDGWVETASGPLDYDDHGVSWWLTMTEAKKHTRV